MGFSNAVQLLGVYEVKESPDVHLIELLVNESPCNVNVSSFLQEDNAMPKTSWQVAYDECFLNEDGTEIVSRPLFDNIYESINVSQTRIAFFLHLIDFSRPLTSQFGNIMLSIPTDMPDRLSNIMEYEPID